SGDVNTICAIDGDRIANIKTTLTVAIVGPATVKGRVIKLTTVGTEHGHESVDHSIRFNTTPTDAGAVFLKSIRSNRKFAVVVFVGDPAGNYSAAVVGYCNCIYLRAAKIPGTETI